MVLFGLVLARLQGLAGEVAALATGRKRLLDRTVQAREEERIRLAADGHDGPIQRLSGIAYTADLSRRRVPRGDVAGGAWQVRSRPGQGTTVTATLPIAGAGRAAEPPRRPGPVTQPTGGRDGG
jgi:signal transduction histidine kinase